MYLKKELGLKEAYNWNVLYQGNLWKDWTEKAFPYKAQKVHEMLKILRDANIPKMAVDMGCGVGMQAKLLADSKLFEKIVALDISSKALKISKKKFGSKNIILYRKADILKLPKKEFEADSLGVVLDLSVSTHLDPNKLTSYLKNVACWLAPEGLFLISVWSANTSRVYNIHTNQNIDCQKISFSCGNAAVQNYFYSKKEFLKLISDYFKVRKINEVSSDYSDKKRLGDIKWWFAFCHKK